jgi:hypothetical protein
MFSTKKVHLLLALFFICNIINLIVFLLVKSKILSIINKIFNSKYNKGLKWHANSKLFVKTLVMMSVYFIVVILLLVKYTPVVTKCLNTLTQIIRKNGIIDFKKIPLTIVLCLGTSYLIFGILLFSCLRLNITETFMNTDIRGIGDSVEGFISGKREGLTNYPYETNHRKNVNGLYLNDHRQIAYNSKFSKFIEQVGSIFFGVGLESKPECCNSNEHTSTGCLCVNPENVKNVRTRGGNHKIGQIFLNSFIDYYPDKDKGKKESLSKNNNMAKDKDNIKKDELNNMLGNLNDEEEE